MKPIIQVQNVSQRFNTASGEFLALQNVVSTSTRAKP